MEPGVPWPPNCTPQSRMSSGSLPDDDSTIEGVVVVIIVVVVHVTYSLHSFLFLIIVVVVVVVVIDVMYSGEHNADL